MWFMYDARGNKVSIPADPFMFWAELHQRFVMSTPEQIHVLWCMNEKTCFGASMLDSDVWNDAFGTTISGQWKVASQGSALRLNLVKQVPQDLFPPNRGPAWLKNRM